MQTNFHPVESSLGVSIVDRFVEEVIVHNAELLASRREYGRLTGEEQNEKDEREELIRFLVANLSGARSIDEISDFDGLKLPPLSAEIREALETARQAEGPSRAWVRPTERVWESVSLFGRLFEPLSGSDEPVVELVAREWFNSLHLLPDDGILLSTGERVIIRLCWSTYFGASETNDIRQLKREAAAIAPSKLWDAKQWSKRQDLAAPNLEIPGCSVPEIIESEYAVDPLSGEPIKCWASIGPASYKSDSQESPPRRSRLDADATFITHWFKSRDEAEKCRAISQALVESQQAARTRSAHRKQRR